MRYHDRPTHGRRASVGAGLAASMALAVISLFNTVSTLGVSSLRATVFAVVGTPIAIVAGVAVTVVLVRVSAVGGDRFAAVRSWRTEVRNSRSERRHGATDSKWWRYVAAYVVIAPVTAGYLFGTDYLGSLGVLLGIPLMFVTVIAAVIALVSVYKDAKRFHESGSTWIPNVTVYVGVPVAAFVVGHYAADFNAWEAPVSMLGFLGACWIAAVVYLLDRRRAVGTA